MTAIFDQVSRTGTRSSLLLDEGRIVRRTEQDVAPILEANRALAAAFRPEDQRNAMGLRRVASIPHVVLLQLEARGIISRPNRRGRRLVIDHQALLRFLDDPDHRWLRTDNGRPLAARRVSTLPARL